MGLQISEFAGLANLVGEVAQIAYGPPINVANVTGEFTTDPKTVIIRISGTGMITWPGISTPETFDGVEYRGVRPGDKFTVA